MGNYCLWLIKIAIYNHSVLISTLYRYDNSDLWLWSQWNADFETAFHRVCFHHFRGCVANEYVQLSEMSSSSVYLFSVSVSLVTNCLPLRRWGNIKLRYRTYTPNSYFKGWFCTMASWKYKWIYLSEYFSNCPNRYIKWAMRFVQRFY